MKQQEATLKAQQEAQEQIRYNQRLQQEILEEKLRQLRSNRDRRSTVQSSSSQGSDGSNGPLRLSNLEFGGGQSGYSEGIYIFHFSDIFQYEIYWNLQVLKIDFT